jgi:Uma2 family endonuclease
MSSMPKRLLTEDEYLTVERKAAYKSEFYRGEMFAMSGASREHELIGGNCFGLLWQKLSKAGCEVYKSDMRFRVAAGTLYVYPDVVAACGEPRFADQETDVLLNPMLLVEVLSDSTADYVRGVKSTHYRTIESLREYLIVEQHQPLVEHVVRQGHDTWLLKTISGLEETIQLASVGMSLQMADIYSQVNFPAGPQLSIHPKTDLGP